MFIPTDFAFFADRHGDPLRERFGDIIEWEGRADTVVFYNPYILAFDSRFIEVRDVSQNGKLVQLVRGTQIRCTFDGQGIAAQSFTQDKNQPHEELLPHVVMREDNVDRLYELVLH